MKKNSPLKQLGRTPQENLINTKAMTKAGLDIIGGGVARRNWEELQLDIKNAEPKSMKIRKLKDQALRDIERNRHHDDTDIALPSAYAKGGFEIIKLYKKELEKALEKEDEIAKGDIKT